MSDKTQKELEKRFDEEFENTMSIFFDRNEKKNKLKTFIRQELASQRKEILEEVKGMKTEVPPAPKLSKGFTMEYVEVCLKYAGRFNYNKALDDVIDYLSQ